MQLFKLLIGMFVYFDHLAQFVFIHISWDEHGMVFVMRSFGTSTLNSRCLLVFEGLRKSWSVRVVGKIIQRSRPSFGWMGGGRPCPRFSYKSTQLL